VITIDKEALKREIEKLKKDFQEYSVDVDSEVGRAVQKSAIKVEGEAKKKFRSQNEASEPGEPPRVQTGRLRSSITHRMESETEALVGTNVEYGFWLEFGTSRMPKHPFLIPAFDESKEKIKEWIQQAMVKVADRVSK
jgi:HK97 gp10 family phage protein